MGSQREIQCPFGLGSGLWTHERSVNLCANPSKPLQTQGVGIPRLARGDKLHHKIAVIDNCKVITGSFNWSPSAAHTHDETLLMFHSSQLAQNFTREMDRLWEEQNWGLLHTFSAYSTVSGSSAAMGYRGAERWLERQLMSD